MRTAARILRAVPLAALALLAALPAAAQDGRRKQEIIFPEIAPRTVDAPPFAIAVRSTSGLPVTLEVVTGPAILDKKVLRLTGEPGLVLIRATQPGDATFAPAIPASRGFEVRPRPYPPAIITQPAGASVEIGDPFTLSVNVRGEPAPSVQWRKDGVPLTDATARTLSFAAASASDSGIYDVVASNPSGTVTSERARVTVAKRHQSIMFMPGGPAVPGQEITLAASASSGLPVQFEVVSGVASLNGATLTSQGGTVVVRALQPGDSTFDAAVPAVQTFVFAGPPPHVQ